MTQDFHLLAPLLAPEADAIVAMLAAIEAPVAARSADYVAALLDPIRRVMPIPAGRQALMSNDPYFIGAAHGRLRFNREETVANLEALLVCPPATILTWDASHFAVVGSCYDEDAGRENYARQGPVSTSMMDATKRAFVHIGAVPPFNRIVAGGTRRLAISNACIGSSSISSLPGYAMIESPGIEGTFGNRQINGLVHEAVHGILFLAECCTGRQLVETHNASQMLSPWSGNVLDTYQFVQALMVWHQLLIFWTGLDPESNERSVAARGFSGLNAARVALEAVREEIAPDFFDLLIGCCQLSDQMVS